MNFQPHIIYMLEIILKRLQRIESIFSKFMASQKISHPYNLVDQNNQF